MSIDDKCGSKRESSLASEVYYSDQYFDNKQLYSLSKQINDIYNFGVNKVIEIGIGNGFVSSFLRKSGIVVKTFDINENLKPDVCCSIEDVPRHINEHYDLTVCCEVLEHIPFENFPSNIDMISKLSDNAYITLPNNKKSFGFGGLIRLPKLKHKEISLYVDIKNTGSLGSGHFWEVGLNRDCNIKNIRRILLENYEEVKVEKYSLNPYHISFKCYESKKYQNIRAIVS